MPTDLGRGSRQPGSDGELGEGVGLEHSFEELVFKASDLFFTNCDLSLHGLILLVGLDGHQLFFKSGEPTLNLGNVLFERCSRGPLLVEGKVRSLHNLGVFSESSFERFEAGRYVLKLSACFSRGVLQLLEAGQRY